MLPDQTERRGPPVQRHARLAAGAGEQRPVRSQSELRRAAAGGEEARSHRVLRVEEVFAADVEVNDRVALDVVLHSQALLDGRIDAEPVVAGAERSVVARGGPRQADAVRGDLGIRGACGQDGRQHGGCN